MKKQVVKVDLGPAFEKIDKAPILDGIVEFTFLTRKGREKRTYKREGDGWRAVWDGEFEKTEFIVKMVYLSARHDKDLVEVKRNAK